MTRCILQERASPSSSDSNGSKFTSGSSGGVRLASPRRHGARQARPWVDIHALRKMTCSSERERQQRQGRQGLPAGSHHPRLCHMRGTGAQPRKRKLPRPRCLRLRSSSRDSLDAGREHAKATLPPRRASFPPLLSLCPSWPGPLPCALARCRPSSSRAKAKGPASPPHSHLYSARAASSHPALRPLARTHTLPPPYPALHPSCHGNRNHAHTKCRTRPLGARGGPRQSSRPAASHCSVVVVSSRRCPARWLLAAARLRCCAWLMPSVAVAAARANISAGTDLLRTKQQFI